MQRNVDLPSTRLPVALIRESPLPQQPSTRSLND
jgi:hypothetical protein